MVRDDERPTEVLTHQVLKGAKGRGGAGGAGGGGSVQRGGHKRKGGQGEATKERAAFVKKRRQLGYDADARLGLSAI